MLEKPKTFFSRSRKAIVRYIFEKPKDTVRRVFSLFTHFKSSSKIKFPQKATVTSELKILPPAIDIGNQNVKFLQLGEDVNGELQIIGIDEEKCLSTEGPVSLIAQKQALSKIIQRNNIIGSCITGLSASNLQVYNLVFPPMPESELQIALHYKLVQIRPFGLGIEKINFGYLKWDITTSATINPQGNRLMVVCVSLDMIEQRMQLLKEAGLIPFSLEIIHISLSNLVEFSKKVSSPEEVTLLLDLGDRESSLVIKKGSQPVFIRPLGFNSYHLTRVIANTLNINEEEADKIKKQYGLIHWSLDKKPQVFLETEGVKKSQDKAAQVYYSIVSHLENLVVDIEHSFKYFSYQITQSQIAKFDCLILSGGGAQLKNLDRFLNVRLGVPVELINPFSLFKISASFSKQETSFLELPANFAISAALALSPKVDPSKHINLLAALAKKPKQIILETIRQKSIKVAVGIACLFIILTFTQIARVAFVKAKMNSFREKVEETKLRLNFLNQEQLKLAKELADVSEKKSLLEAQLNLLKKGLRKPEKFFNILSICAGLLPEELWVTRLGFKEGKLNINGSTTNVNLIIQLVDNLKAKDEFFDATFTYAQQDPRTGVYNFEAIAQIR